MDFKSFEEIPTLIFNKTELKKEIKSASYSYCYMCPVRKMNNCNFENRKLLHCISYKKAEEINKAIDIAYSVVKLLKKDSTLKKGE